MSLSTVFARVCPELPVAPSLGVMTAAVSISVSATETQAPTLSGIMTEPIDDDFWRSSSDEEEETEVKGSGAYVFLAFYTLVAHVCLPSLILTHDCQPQCA